MVPLNYIFTVGELVTDKVALNVQTEDAGTNCFMGNLKASEDRGIRHQKIV